MKQIPKTGHLPTPVYHHFPDKSCCCPLHAEASTHQPINVPEASTHQPINQGPLVALRLAIACANVPGVGA